MSVLPEDWQQQAGEKLVQRVDVIKDTFVVQMDVAIAAKETVKATWELSSNGAKGVDDTDDPALTVSLSQADALALISGESPLPLGFMRGAVKIAGDPNAALELLKAAAPN